MELEASPNGSSGWVKRGPTSLGLPSNAQISRIKKMVSGEYYCTGQDFRGAVAPNVHKNIRFAKPLLRKLNAGSNGLGDSSTDMLTFQPYLGLDWDGNGTATGTDAGRGISSGQVYTNGGSQTVSSSRNTRYPTRIFPNEWDIAEDKDGHIIAIFRCGPGGWDGWAGAQSTKYIFVRMRKQSNGKYLWPAQPGTDFFEAPFNPPLPRVGGPVHPCLLHFTAGQDDVIVFAARRNAELNPSRFYYSLTNGVSWVGFGANITAATAEDPYYAQAVVLNTSQSHVKKVCIFGSSQRDLDPSTTVDFLITEYQFTFTGTPDDGPTPPAAPTFAPNGGTFQDTVTVSMSAPAGCVIHYTTNGADPTSASPTATSLTFTSTTTLKAISRRTADNQISGIKSALFTVQDTPPVPQAPTFSPNGGQFTGSVVVTLTAEADCTIRYTMDGTTPTSTVGTLINSRSGQVTLTVDTTLKAVAIRAGAPSASAVKSASFDAVDSGGGGDDVVLTGPFRPGSVVNDIAVGTKPWNELDSAVGSDNVKAYCGLDNSQVGNYAKATEFPLSLPANASSVKEVVFRLERAQTSSSGNAQDNKVVLVKNNVPQSTPDKAAGTIWPTELTGDVTVTITFSEADLAGYTPQDVVGSGFGLAVSPRNPAGTDTFAKIDDLYIQSVTFGTTAVAKPPAPTVSPPAGSLQAGSFTVTLACADESADIYYSTSASTNPNFPPDPDPGYGNYQLYTGPFQLSVTDGGVRKVKAVADNGVQSDITLAEWTTEEITTPPAPVIAPSSRDVAAQENFFVTISSSLMTATLAYVTTLSDTGTVILPDRSYSSGSAVGGTLIAERAFTSPTSSGGTPIADNTYNSGDELEVNIPPEPELDLSNYTIYSTPVLMSVPVGKVLRVKAVARSASGILSPTTMTTYTAV
jgi:hypothetical protein